MIHFENKNGLFWVRISGWSEFLINGPFIMDVPFTEFRRPRPCIFGKKILRKNLFRMSLGYYLRSVLTFIVDWIFSVICLLPFISENCIPSGANLVRNYVLLKLFFTVNYSRLEWVTVFSFDNSIRWIVSSHFSFPTEKQENYINRADQFAWFESRTLLLKVIFTNLRVPS